MKPKPRPDGATHPVAARDIPPWRSARLSLALVGVGIFAVAAAAPTVPLSAAVLARARADYHVSHLERHISQNATSSGLVTVVPGAKVRLAWPHVGQSAVVVRGVGIVGDSPNERPVPIASLTKMMTALVFLFDHPLTGNDQGPVLTVSAADVATYHADIEAGDSTLRVAVGERLSEYRLLEGLLLPSGDNIAELLADWDAGSVTAFVEKMNAMAQTLGLSSTHYADASGVSPGSQSTAVDQADLAATLMGLPVIRHIVRMRHVVLPVAGSVPNFNPAIGAQGIIGVKSGWTGEAQSCLATAAYRKVGARSVLVVAVTLGQRKGLVGAARTDERMLARATRALIAVDAVAPNATIDVPVAGGTAALVAPSDPTVVVGWPGLELSDQVDDTALRGPGGVAQYAVGSLVGTLEVDAPSGALAEVPLRLGATRVTTTTTPNAPTGS